MAGPVKSPVTSSRPELPALRPDLRPRLRGVSHQWAAAVFAALGVALVLGADGADATIVCAVYSASVVALLAVSAVYHRVLWRTPAERQRMRRVDHAMIFVLIAGSYTPFAALAVGGGAGAAVLAVVWTGAAVGIVSTVFWIRAPRWVTAGSYLALGWMAVPLAPLLWGEVDLAPVILVAIGGAMYTAGAVIYARKRPDPAPLVFGYHEIFHALVIAAAALHFAAVAFWIVPDA